MSSFAHSILRLYIANRIEKEKVEDLFNKGKLTKEERDTILVI